MKKEKSKILKEKYAGSFTGKKDKAKAADQPNLFGEQDAAYNTIQEEITIVQDAIKGCQDAIEKKEDQLTDLMARIGKLNRAAETVAKLRDGTLKKKAEDKESKK